MAALLAISAWRHAARAAALVAAAVAATLGVVACAGDGIVGPAGGGATCSTDPNFAFDPTFTCIQDLVFSPTCARSGCHLGATAQLGLNLAPGAAYGHLVGVASVENPSLLRVAPGDPNASYMVLKIEGDPNALPRMPLNRPPLSQAKIDVIREWIARGALDD